MKKVILALVFALGLATIVTTSVTGCGGDTKTTKK
jgi:hypothetical protein